MPQRFDQDDGSLVLIIGSGAGGGTLGNELAQKGIRTLILEAGPGGKELYAPHDWHNMGRVR